MHRISRRLRTLNISFGAACNKHCSYCLQESTAQSKKGDPEYFLREFSSFVSKHIDYVETIHYWGGEPILYWDQIKRVYLGLNALLSDAKTHRITTNGSLVNQEYVDFCNAHPNIVTVVSLHECDLPDEQWRIIGRLNRVFLSGLFRKGRETPLAYFHEWYRIKELTQKSLPFGIYLLRATDGCNPASWITKEDVDWHFECIENVVQPLANQGEEYCQKFMGNFVYEMREQHTIKSTGAKCFNDSILSLDLFGNRFCCHHNETKENMIANIFTKTMYAQDISPLKHFNSKECQECPALGVCKGGCYLTNRHDVECYYMKRRWQYFKSIEHGLK